MKDRIEAFLTDLDRVLTPAAQGRTLDIYHIGRSALVWQFAYNATTDDFDILRPDDAADLVDLAVRFPGPDTPQGTGAPPVP